MKRPAHKPTFSIMLGAVLVLTSFAVATNGTPEDILSQKILLENTIQQRVSDAVYRILRNENFIVNVNVDMQVDPGQEYTTVYETPGEEGKQKSAPAAVKTRPQPRSAVEQDSQTKTKTVLKKRPIKSVMPSDIPGFPGIQKPGFELYEEEVVVPEEETVMDLTGADSSEVMAATTPVSVPEEDIREEDLEGQPLRESEAASASIEYGDIAAPRLSRHTVASTSAPSYRVRRMEITIILEDGIDPTIRENIRNVAMVASHFNRERGDKISLPPANFKASKEANAPDAEELLLKSIAEKMTVLEARQKEEAEAKKIRELEAEQERLRLEQENRQKQEAEMLRLRQLEEQRIAQREQELKQLREAEERRIKEREDELKAIREAEEQRLAEERRRIFEAQQEQARDRLRQDSLRLALLTEQLGDLKAQLSAVDLEEEQRLKIELEQKRREAEKEALQDQQNQLQDRLRELEEMKLKAAAVPTSTMDSTLVYIIIGAAALIAFFIGLAVLMSGRRRRAPLEPKPALKPAPLSEPEPEVEEEPEKKPEPEPEPDEKELAEVAAATAERKVREEVDGIKKSVISLAVSKPQSASNIINDWLKDTGAHKAEEEGSDAKEGEPETVENGEK